MRFAGFMVALVCAGCGGLSQPDDAGRDGGSASDGGLARPDAGLIHDGGSSFCASCVSSAECGPGSFCMGGVSPRCGQDCASSMTCSGGSSCEALHFGKGPIFAHQCLADLTPGCGAFVRRGDLTCTDTWANYGQTFFATVCTGACHRHDLAWQTVDDVRLSADSIRIDVENGSMPQDLTLSAAERQRLLVWLACGAP